MQRIKAGFAGFAFIWVPVMAAAAPAVATIFEFGAVPDSSGTADAPIQDTFGALYGTSTYGGHSRDGTVFKLTPPAAPGGSWAETILHEFSGPDGYYPSSSLVMDTSGKLYGTVPFGGLHNCGTVYSLSPPLPGGTNWSFATIYDFQCGTDGGGPVAALVLDSAGDLLGTTESTSFGVANSSTVFRLEPPVSPQTSWTKTILYLFPADGSRGTGPNSPLLIGRNGDLYGTTEGAAGGALTGTVYQLNPPVPGQTAWREQVLHTFKGATDGKEPLGALAADETGALYGTTYQGGAYGFGTVFKLTPPLTGQTKWIESVVHDFAGAPDGETPASGIVRDKHGTLYGTTEYGGSTSSCVIGCGVIFRLTPPQPGQTLWAETTVLPTPDMGGADLQGGLLLSRTKLFGFAAAGGVDGTAYEVKAPAR